MQNLKWLTPKKEHKQQVGTRHGSAERLFYNFAPSGTLCQILGQLRGLVEIRKEREKGKLSPSNMCGCAVAGGARGALPGGAAGQGARVHVPAVAHRVGGLQHRLPRPAGRPAGAPSQGLAPRLRPAPGLQGRRPQGHPPCISPSTFLGRLAFFMNPTPTTSKAICGRRMFLQREDCGFAFMAR